MSEQSLSLALDSGDSSLYPFDSYSLQFEIVATVNNNGTISQIPVLLTTQSVLPLFKIDSTIPSFPDTAEVTAAVHFERSRTAKFFSIFIIINMWVLGCSLFALATGIWIRGRKVEPPTIAACLAFIFALPNGKDL